MKKVTFFTLSILFCSIFSFSQVTGLKVVHVFVALCDNESQGIVPVPKQLGNGDDPRNNLYWGALYGVKTHFKKSSDWKFVSSSKVCGVVLERVVLKHKTKNVYIVADAYRGKKIRRAVVDFFNSAAGSGGKSIDINGKKLSIFGNSNLVVFIGHNGLMDFKLKDGEIKKGSNGVPAIALACKTKQYFSQILESVKSKRVLLTTGFMAPEAYTLKGALDGWMIGEDGERIRARAAKAYNKYQKCGIKGATRLFFSE